MKCVCVAGFGSVPQRFHFLLTQAGMAPALPVNRQPPLDMYLWYRQVAEVLEGLPSDESSQPPKLGRMWERLASEIFLANSSVPFWGWWADESSVRLLEFWLDFDPRINFVLLFTNPESVVIAHLDNPSTNQHINAVLDGWKRHSQYLFDFGVAHQKRCLMLDADVALSTPKNAFESIISKWKGIDRSVSLDSSGEQESLVAKYSIELLIARQLLRGNRGIRELWKTILGNLSNLRSNHSSLANTSFKDEDLVASYRSLRNEAVEARKTKQLQEKCAQYEEELCSGSQRIQELERMSASSSAELEKVKMALADAENRVKEQHKLHAEFKAAEANCRVQGETLHFLEQRLKESVDKNEALLAFLFQAQDELEASLNRCEELKALNGAQQKQMQDQLATALQAHQASLAEVATLQTALLQLRNKHEKVLSVVQQLNETLLERSKQNELLFERLCQVQGDYESLLMQFDRQQKAAAKERSAVEEKLTRELEYQEKIVSELNFYKSEVNKLAAASERERKELALAKEDLAKLAQQACQQHADRDVQQRIINKLTKEREKYYKHSLEVEARLTKAMQQLQVEILEANKWKKTAEDLRKEKDHIISKVNLELKRREQSAEELAKAAAILEKQLQESIAVSESANQRVCLAERRIELLTDENSALISQLHQVQEELEKSFIQNQVYLSTCATLESKLRKMRGRYPDYAEAAKIELLEDDGQCATWRLTDLTLANADYPLLRFSTVIEHGMAGFVFDEQNNKLDHFFDYWPTGRKTLTLLPLGTPDQVEERAAALLQLSEREWQRFLALANFLISVLDTESIQVVTTSTEFQPGIWVKALKTLQADLMQFPLVPRFEKLRLKREQVNPDYEHLWLAFDHLSIGGQMFSHFEFRVSCANVMPGSFGKFPKLEFPEDFGKQLLESWFEESSDDFGPKLELRYALPEAMDLMVWNKLSQRDQSILKSLVNFLPLCFQRLRESGISLSRSWNDWENMVRNILHITRLRVGGRQDMMRSTSGTLTDSGRIKKSGTM